MTTASLGWLQRVGPMVRGRRRGYATARGASVLSADVLLAPSESRAVGLAFDPAKLLLLWIDANARATISRGTSGTNEVQSVALGGGTLPTQGDVSLDYAAGNTATFPWDATAGQVQAAYEGASWIAPGDVSCTGGPLPSTAVLVEFTGALAGTNIAGATPPHTYSGLYDGSPMVVTTITDGAAGSVADLVPVEPTYPVVWLPEWPDACPFTAAATSLTFDNLSPDRQTRVRFRALLEA